MTKYQELMERSEKCSNLALDYYRKHEIKLAVFWNNAAKEFKERALALKVGD